MDRIRVVWRYSRVFLSAPQETWDRVCKRRRRSEAATLRERMCALQVSRESKRRPRNFPVDLYRRGALYKERGGGGRVRERVRKIEKDLAGEKRKP